MPEQIDISKQLKQLKTNSIQPRIVQKKIIEEVFKLISDNPENISDKHLDELVNNLNLGFMPSFDENLIETAKKVIALKIENNPYNKSNADNSIKNRNKINELSDEFRKMMEQNENSELEKYSLKCLNLFVNYAHRVKTAANAH